jgi:hypothetical protein
MSQQTGNEGNANPTPLNRILEQQVKLLGFNR